MNGAIRFYEKLPELVVAWTGEEYIQCVDHCVEVIESVNPDVVVADIAFSHARKTCSSISRQYMVLSPKAALEYFSVSQPWLAMFCKYPA